MMMLKIQDAHRNFANIALHSQLDMNLGLPTRQAMALDTAPNVHVILPGVSSATVSAIALAPSLFTLQFALSVLSNC